MEKEVGVLELAAIIGINRSRIQELVKEGILHKNKNGKFNLKESIQAFLDYQKQKFKKETEDVELEEAERRKKIAEARLKELELAEKEGILVNVEEVKKEWIKQVSNARAKLLAIPAKYAPIIMTAENENEAKKILEDAIYEALNELSED